LYASAVRRRHTSVPTRRSSDLTAVVPYLAEQFAEAQEAGGMAKVRTAITAGLRKVLARMGVSTLASYRNSCLFEIVGLSEQFVSDRKSTRLNSSHVAISYAVFC